MRIVVDCSALQPPSPVSEFLKRAPVNRAVLIDVASYDVFAAGSGAVNILSSLFHQSNQVILLRPTWELWRQRPKRNGFVPQMIDHEQSRAFPRYCELLAIQSPIAMQNLKRKEIESQAFGDKLLADAGPLLDVMRAEIAAFHADDLRALRSGHNLSERLCSKLVEDVVSKAARELWNAQGAGVRPTSEEIKASLILRLLVCSTALSVRRAADGSAAQISPRTMRNDLNDCFYAAYATLFDGLLSRDPGLVETYNLALMLLENVFDCRRMTANKAVVSPPP